MIEVLAAHLMAAALALPGPWYPPGNAPETPQERRARLETIMAALAIEAVDPPDGWGWSPEDLAWAGFVVTRSESRRWALEVHEGRKRGDGGRSVCLGMIWGGGADLVGTSLEATRRCVREVYSHLAQHWERCLRPATEPSAWAMGSVFAGYGTGHSCNPMHESPVPHLGRGWALNRGRMWWGLR